MMEQSVVRAAAARSQAGSAVGGLFRMEKMAEGAWAALAAPAAIVNCNAAIFELSDGLLVVDSHSKPSAAAALVKQIGREVSAKPVRYLVNSHFHFDHMQGNQVYREDGRRAVIIASEATRRLMSERADAWLKRTMDGARRSLEEARKRLAEVKGAEERAAAARLAADTGGFLEEMKSFRLELPDITVKGDLTIHDKEQELKIVFRGRGHTEGDISVWSPTRRVLAAGDLAHGGMPYFGDGYPQDWPRTLDGLSALEFERFVGGHGGTFAGKQAMGAMRDYITELTAVVEEARRAGRPVQELRKAVTVDNLKSMRGGYLDVLRLEARDEAIAATVAANIGQIWSALGRG